MRHGGRELQLIVYRVGSGVWCACVWAGGGEGGQGGLNVDIFSKAVYIFLSSPQPTEPFSIIYRVFSLRASNLERKTTPPQLARVLIADDYRFMFAKPLPMM